jgi:hypothetical protein
MNAHDWELLDKQLHGFSSRPPQNRSAVSLVVVAMFLAGMAVGGVLFAHDSSKPEIASRAVMVAYSLLGDVPPRTTR